MSVIHLTDKHCWLLQMIFNAVITCIQVYAFMFMSIFWVTQDKYIHNLSEATNYKSCKLNSILSAKVLFFLYINFYYLIYYYILILPLSHLHAFQASIPERQISAAAYNTDGWVEDHLSSRTKLLLVLLSNTHTNLLTFAFFAWQNYKESKILLISL